ncbi:MAG: heavy metal transporter [Clostridiales bacterium]|nr:heavy metal transporter [Clostridiales bacterium]
MANNIKAAYKLGGMACTGCEAVIEEALLKLEGVSAARAVFGTSSVEIEYDPEWTTFEKLQAAAKAAGYTITAPEAFIDGAAQFSNSSRKSGSTGNPASKYKSASGNSDNSGNTLSPLQFAGIVIIIIAAGLIIGNTVGFSFIPEVTSSMGYGVLFVVGLLTSLHCIAMCGGINISVCVNAGKKSGSGDAGGNGSTSGIKGESVDGKVKLVPSLLYNLGRVTSYTAIGGVIGAIGSVLSFSGWARGIIAILSGIFMIIMGISMLGIFPWINKITPRLPRFLRQKAGSAGHGKGPFAVGLVNGLMPCGPLQAMQVYALGTGSFMAGAMSMFFFSLGTLPLMFGLGAIITMLGSRFTKNMIKASAVLVAILGIIMLGRGLALSGVAMPGAASSSEAATASGATASGSAASVSGSAEAASGTAAVASGTAVSTDSSGNKVQNITTTLTSEGYPDITVQKGIPVVWNLKADAGVLTGCNRTLVIPAYNLEVKLKAGDNIIEFTPSESGIIPYSCWMGMITADITVK